MLKSFNEFTVNEGWFDWLTGETDGADQDSAIDSYYKTLTDFAASGKSIPVQAKGQMAYSKMVEDIQAALVFLGYQLPKYGVDGLFGPETAAAIEQFKASASTVSERLLKSFDRFVNEDLVPLSTPTADQVTIDSSLINQLVAALKAKNFSQTDLEKYVKANAESGVKVQLTNQDDIEFYKAILKGLGVNETPEKIKFLEAWRQGEGGHARNNPFNTTKDIPGDADTKYNSVGVRNYPDRQTGLDATIATLKLPYYRDIVQLLHNDNVTAQELANTQGLKTWGTGENVKKVLSTGQINPPAIAAESRG